MTGLSFFNCCEAYLLYFGDNRVVSDYRTSYDFYRLEMRENIGSNKNDENLS